MKLSKTIQFIAAISNGKIEDASLLLSNGVDINVNDNGTTALHTIAESSGSLIGLRWLIENNCDLNLLDSNKLTALMISCGRKGKKATEVSKVLIEAGADIHIRRSSDSMSAIEFAAGDADSEVLKLLISNGANINGLENASLFPALLAVRERNLENLKILVKHHCDLSKRTKLKWAYDMTCLDVAKIEKSQAIVKYLKSIGAPETT